MQKVILTTGLPGSGKSFWAKQFVLDNPNYVRINRDDLRNMRGRYWVPKQESLITSWQEACVREALACDYNLVLDDTNLNPKTCKHWEELVLLVSNELHREIKVEYKDFTHVSIEVCLERDLQRPNSVGEKVIRMMYNKYLAPQETYKPDPNLPHVVLCDLDGTLCLFGNKNAYDRDFENDTPNMAVLQVLKNLPDTTRVFFFSGRDSKYVGKTKEWLYTNGFDLMNHNRYLLAMRAEGDNRKDALVKHEFFDAYVRDKFYVDFVLDDRNQVVELWRSLGLTCFQVAPGDF